MPKILVLDDLSPEGVTILRQAPGFEVDVKPPQTTEQLAAIIGDYEGLVVRSGTKVTADAFAKAKKLKVVSLASVGVDSV
ncbi:MAG: phosphoglycerate dehydrogenase, partial [Candidatus Hydrogenedentota bacterium]